MMGFGQTYGKGKTNGRPWRIGLDRLTPQECIEKWPKVVAHVMAECGWLRPMAAGQVVADALNGCAKSNIPWVIARFDGDPLEALKMAIEMRHHHKDSEHSYALMRDTVLHSIAKTAEQIAVVC